jgi:hypothetical protein
MNYMIKRGINFGEVSTQLCVCGCGEFTAPGKQFIRGHHARVYSLLLNYVRGDITLKQLPANVQKIARENGISPNKPLPINFPKFKNRYSARGAK